MRKIVVLSLMVFLIGLLACGGANAPSKVIEKFYKLTENGKVNDAYELISEDGKRVLEKFGGGVSILSNGTKEIGDKGGIKNFEIVNEDIKGDTAIVRYKITYGNGETKTSIDKLIKEDGQWRITVAK